jgi:HTH-like domain
LVEAHRCSERRACGLVGLARSVARYLPRRRDDAELRARLRELAGEHRRFGYLRLHALLRQEGLVINRKKTYRLYRTQDLAVSRRSGSRAGSVRSDSAPRRRSPRRRDRATTSTAHLRRGPNFGEGQVEIRAYADRVELRQEGRVVGEHRHVFGRGQTVYRVDRPPPSSVHVERAWKAMIGAGFCPMTLSRSAPYRRSIDRFACRGLDASAQANRYPWRRPSTPVIR